MSRKKLAAMSAKATDRLSDLPDCLILHILSFVETRDAVRTSLLSRRWKGVWASVSTLNFNSQPFLLNAQFNDFIRLVLFKRKPYNLQRLIFHEDSTYSCGPSFIKRVFRYANLHGVQEIDTTEPSSVPLALSCRSLRTLKVRNCSLTALSELRLSLGLTTLHLHNVSTVGFFPSLHNVQAMCLTNCVIHLTNVVEVDAPRLSNLAVSFVAIPNWSSAHITERKVIFAAPMLSEFHYDGEVLPELFFKESQALHNVRIHLTTSMYYEGFGCELTNQLKQFLPYAKLLTLKQPNFVVKIATYDSHLYVKLCSHRNPVDEELFLPVQQEQVERLIKFTAIRAEFDALLDCLYNKYILPKVTIGEKQHCNKELININKRIFRLSDKLCQICEKIKR